MQYEEVPKKYTAQLLEAVHAEALPAFTLTLRYKEGFSHPHRDVFASDRAVVPQAPRALLVRALLPLLLWPASREPACRVCPPPAAPPGHLPLVRHFGAPLAGLSRPAQASRYRHNAARFQRE